MTLIELETPEGQKPLGDWRRNVPTEPPPKPAPKRVKHRAGDLSTPEGVEAEIAHVEERIASAKDANTLSNLANRLAALKLRLEQAKTEEAAAKLAAAEKWLNETAPKRRAELLESQRRAEQRIMESLGEFRSQVQAWIGTLIERRAFEEQARQYSAEADRTYSNWTPSYPDGVGLSGSAASHPRQWSESARYWLRLLPDTGPVGLDQIRNTRGGRVIPGPAEPTEGDRRRSAEFGIPTKGV